MSKEEDIQLLTKHNRKWASKIVTCSRGLTLWLRQGKFIAIPIIVTISSAWFLGARWNLLMPIMLLNVMLITAEIFNTSIEKLCNEVNAHWNKEIKEVKDISSSTVLVIGITLLVIWIWVLIDSFVRYQI